MYALCPYHTHADIVSVLADPPEGLDLGSGFHFVVAEASTRLELALLGGVYRRHARCFRACARPTTPAKFKFSTKEEADERIGALLAAPKAQPAARRGSHARSQFTPTPAYSSFVLLYP